MSDVLLDLVAPFARVDPASVADLLRRAWGLDARSLTRLDTERDDTFRVDLAGAAVLVKVAHPADPGSLLDLQDAALAAADDHGLPVPVLRPTRDGSPRAELEGRAVRVLSWLEGEPAGSRLEPRAAGRMLARLSAALEPVDHPAGDRVLGWDLRRVPELAALTDEPLLRDAIARFAAEVSPALDALPRGLRHNDFHPGNVLLDDSGAISGVIDFGDVVRTARVCDLGVTLCYLIPADGPGDAVRAELLAGFEEIAPLEPEERALIPGLVAGRELQRVIINEELGRRLGGSHAPTRVRRLLHRALEDWR